MAPRTTTRTILGLALLCSATLAAAANPLGSAVAGAPSLFVLAVVESRADDREPKAATREQENGQDPSAQAQDRARQAARQAHREDGDNAREPAGDRQLTLR